MRVGVLRETKSHEYRVSLTPAGVRELYLRGHEVIVESNAGAGSAISNDEYVAAGARIVHDTAEVWGEGELLLKVKEPTSEEYKHLRAGQTLFAYLHLAASHETTRALVDSGVTAIGYEMVQTDSGRLPLLVPMSEIAGALAPQVAAHTLIKTNGGRGVLLGGVPGAAAGEVVIIGAGVSGLQAARVASGMQARVVLMDTNVDALRAADAYFRGAVQTLVATTDSIERAVATADVVIGAVLVPGALAPRVVTNEMVAAMKPGSVLIDLAVDQGGCFEDTRPTSHAHPTYAVHQSVFYAVSNMPGTVPVTATAALTNATLPYICALADLGPEMAAATDRTLAAGLNVAGGQLVAEAVAAAHNMQWQPFSA